MDVRCKHADIIERNVEKTNLWLNDLGNELETDDRQAAYRVSQDSNLRIAQPARAASQIDLTGPVVGGHLDNVEMRHAIDTLAKRMEHQLRRFFDRHLDDERRPAQRPTSEWRHGDSSLPRTRRRPPPEADRR
jgi:hypothetical protein